MPWFSWFSATPKPSSDQTDLSVTFNYKDEKDLKTIQDKINKFNQALYDIQWIDKAIVIGAVGVGVGYVGSYVFPLTLAVIIPSALVAGHYHGARPAFNKQYFEALQELIDVYDWSMKKGSCDYWYKLGTPVLQDLILTLGPWVTSKTIHTWEDSDLEPGRVCKRKQEITAVFKHQLIQFQSDVQSARLAFRLYGNEGGVNDILGSIQDGASALVKENLSTLAKMS